MKTTTTLLRNFVAFLLCAGVAPSIFPAGMGQDCNAPDADAIALFNPAQARHTRIVPVSLLPPRLGPNTGEKEESLRKVYNAWQEPEKILRGHCSFRLPFPFRE